MRLGDGEVVHGLGALKEQHRLDFARIAIYLCVICPLLMYIGLSGLF
ncbi:MAG: hypothetical protein L0154_24925 [Chloroflexi bacterium]|nr:hypothetical protein [Chloroflexota bacterium]